MKTINFSEIAARYERDSLIQKSASEKLLGLIGIGRNEDVLDLGCGTGNLTRKIKGITQGSVAGVDPSEGMIREAAKGGQAGAGGTYFQQNLPACGEKGEHAMTTVSEHYENLLAEYYSWMFGDFEAKVEANRRFFEDRNVLPAKTGTAVDLGAGPGFQSIALARLGFTVSAVDLSQKLLDELKQRNGTGRVTVVRDDIMNVYRHCPAPVELIVCMGDTLPHLDSFQNVGILFDRSARSLLQGGRLVLTFRDLTQELKGTDRFIPVRSDADRIFTCFLEYGHDRVQVHDLVYERKNDAWQFRKSSYSKLRISFDWTLERLKTAGFSVISGEKDKGMITIIAEKTR